MRRLAGLATVVLVLAAACGSDDAATQPAGPPSDPNPGLGREQAQGVDASFEIVAYQGSDALGGSEIDFASLLGRGTPVILNFWAAQCPPCLAEMPWFESAWQDSDGSVLLVGVDVGPFTQLGTNEQGAELLSELGITYPAAYAADDAPLREFSVTSMPTTVFFDGAGQIVDKHGGLLSEQQIRDWFATLSGGVS
ncbi:MAG TPA: TlpA disulfide reductase family protein [Jiangellaceae bacterium]